MGCAFLHFQVPNGGVLPFLRKHFAKPRDIFLINYGIWHRKEGDRGYAEYDSALKALAAYYEVRDAA
jgi:hypothetical protein